MSKKDLSLILACFNEGPSFERSVNKIESVLRKLEKDWEIIFVEDKSTDNTRQAVEKIIQRIPEASALFHRENEGRGKAVSDGLKVAHGRICGYLDADLEVSADYIPIFISEVERGSDMVIGRRFYEGSLNSLLRVVASKFYAFLVKLFLNLQISDTEAGYKFFRREQILPILSKVKDRGWFWDTEICARAIKAGLEVSEVPVLFVKRADKKSTVKFIPDSVTYLSKLVRFRRELAIGKV